MGKEQNNAKYHCKLGLLSKYRAEFMGFAILIVIFTHSVDFGVNYPSFFGKIVNSSYGRIGQIAVNIFFMVSGIGMYYSLSKNNKNFYKRRFEKILPSYFMISIPVFLIVDIIMDHENIGIFLLDVSTLRWWIFGIGYWYVAVQLALYVIIPFHHKLCQKFGWSINLIVISFGLITAQILSIFSIETVSRFFERYAVFIAGYWLAKGVKNDIKLPLIVGVIAVLLLPLKMLLHFSYFHIMHFWQ